MMRDYMVRFWRRMLRPPYNRPASEVELLLETGMITQEEYDAIMAP